MIDKGTIKNLAELARIELSPTESDKIQKDLSSVLDYVSELKNAPVNGVLEAEKEHINIFREDKNPHESGEYTEKILSEAPKLKDLPTGQADNYFVVKQIMEEKKRITN